MISNNALQLNKENLDNNYLNYFRNALIDKTNLRPIQLNIKLSGEETERNFPLFQRKSNNEKINHFITNKNEPLLIDFIDYSDKDYYQLDLTLNFNGMKTIDEVIQICKMYNDFLLNKGKIFDEPIYLDPRINKPILVSEEDFKYFQEIKEIENWLNKSFSNFENLFEENTLDDTDIFLRAINKKPSKFSQKILDISANVVSDEELDRMKKILNNNEDYLLSFYFKTEIPFRYLNQQFTLPALMYINDFKLVRLDEVKKVAYFNISEKDSAYISYLPFNSKENLNKFYNSTDNKTILETLKLE